MAKAHNIRAVHTARKRRDGAPSNRLIQRTNNMLSPLFELDEEANLYMTEKMAKRLRVAGLEHIGKNIPRI